MRSYSKISYMINSRQLTLQHTVRYFIAALFWIPVTFFSLLLVRNTIPYFSFSQDFSFIQERAILFARSIYKYSFYIHIFAGMVCISTALVQFSTIIIKKEKDTYLERQNLCDGCVVVRCSNRIIHELFCQRLLLGKDTFYVYGGILVLHNHAGLYNNSQKKCTGS